jgi:hypothetical protein
VVMLVVMYGLTRSLFRVDFEWRRLALVVVVAGGLTAAGELLAPTAGAGGFLLRALVLLAIVPVLLAARFFRPGELDAARRLAARARRGRRVSPPVPR